MLNLKLLEELHIFIFEDLFSMMFFLVQNVVVDICDLRMTVRKCPIAFLPAKLSFYPFMVIDEIRGVVLNIPHQIRQSHRRFQTNEDMNMIRNTIDDDWLLSLVFDNPRHIFENFMPPFPLEEVLASLHSEDDLDVDLGICARHKITFSDVEKIMSSLRDLILAPYQNLGSFHPCGIYYMFLSARILSSLGDF